MYDLKNSHLPRAFNETWILNRDIEGYRLRNDEDYYLPRFFITPFKPIHISRFKNYGTI